MGRGLSDMQQWILRRAATQHRLYYSEVLADYFHFQATWKNAFRRHGPNDKDSCGQPYPEGDLAHASGQRFSRKAIGAAKYNRSMAALSRSCDRLQRRGLVECISGMYARWAAVTITDKGREWLSVNTVAETQRC